MWLEGGTTPKESMSATCHFHPCRVLRLLSCEDPIRNHKHCERGHHLHQIRCRPVKTSPDLQNRSFGGCPRPAQIFSDILLLCLSFSSNLTLPHTKNKTNKQISLRPQNETDYGFLKCYTQTFLPRRTWLSCQWWPNSAQQVWWSPDGLTHQREE